MYAFINSMIDGYKCLMKSAEKQMVEDENGEIKEEEKPSKLELWLEAHFTEKTVETIMLIFTVASMVIALGMFLFLPKWIVGAF